MNTAFHIGRGGNFYNAGHKTFVGFKSIDDLIPETAGRRPANWTPTEDGIIDLFLQKEWDELKQIQKRTGLNDEDFREVTLDDGGSESIVFEQNTDGTGEINWDWDYDRYIVRNIEDCDEQELKLILASGVSSDIEQQIRDIAALNDYEL